MKQKNIARMAIVLTVVLLTAGCLGFGGGNSGPPTTEEGLTADEVAERAVVSMSNVDSYTYETQLSVYNQYEDIRNNETIASSEERLNSSAVITHNRNEYLSEHRLGNGDEVTRVRGYYTDGERNYSRVSGNWGIDDNAPDRYYTNLYSEFNWSSASIEETDSTVTLTLTEESVDPATVTDNVFETDTKVINGNVSTVSENITVTMTVDKNDRYVEELTIDMEYAQENDNPTQSTVERDIEMEIVYTEHGTTTVAAPALLV